MVVVGVALAVPGIIDFVMRGALDIKEGTLHFSLITLSGASKDRVLPTVIQAQLDKALGKVQSELASIQQGLSHVHEDTFGGKLRYTFWRSKGSKYQLEQQSQDLKSSCDRLKDLCLQLHNHQRSQSSHLLTLDVFKIRDETSDNRPGSALPDSDVIVASGNYHVNGRRVAADFILEEKLRENDVRYLCEKLSKQQLGAAIEKSDLDGSEGVLPILGYRQPPYNEADGTTLFQLIFQLAGDVSHDSLAHWICTKQDRIMVERLKLCLQLARAIGTVHRLGLIHKAIRPWSILMLSGPPVPILQARMYLQDWTYVREISGATTQLGETDWKRAIYQHPKRQGKYAEAAYEAKHDIYSLGVSMLEILLWKPFVTPNPGRQTGAPPRVCELFQSYGLARGEQDGGLPARYKGHPIKLTSRPWATNTIWCDIASLELGDYQLAQMVLNCLEGRFRNVDEVKLCLETLLRIMT